MTIQHMLTVPAAVKQTSCETASVQKETDLSQDGVLVVPDWNVLVLGGAGDDLDQAANLRLVVQRHAEQFCTFHSQRQFLHCLGSALAEKTA